MCAQSRRFSEQRDYRQRTSKLYFDKMDRFVLEEFLPESLKFKMNMVAGDSEEE